MTDFLGRLRAEHHELNVRCGKLRDFLTSAKFKDLEPGAQTLLLEQKAAMDKYLAILGARLELHDQPGERPIGEPVEIGGFDIDRDGAIPFN